MCLLPFLCFRHHCFPRIVCVNGIKINKMAHTYTNRADNCSPNWLNDAGFMPFCLFVPLCAHPSHLLSHTNDIHTHSLTHTKSQTHTLFLLLLFIRTPACSSTRSRIDSVSHRIFLQPISRMHIDVEDSLVCLI